MRDDLKSNYEFSEAVAAKSYGSGVTTNSNSVDHAKASSASFYVSVGTVGASGTIDVKSQYSDDNVAWTDYPANDPAGNDDAITQITAAGSAQINIPNPRGRYSRVVLTTAVAASVVCITAGLGPLRHASA